MANSVYKTINAEVAKNRQLKPLATAKKTKVRETLNRFITYLKLAHS